MARPLLFALIFPVFAHAAAESFGPSQKASATDFVSENDYYGGHSDRYYTNGLRLTYVSEPMNREGEDSLRWFAGAAHEIYTPGERESVNPPENDHPYSAWLYLTGGIVMADERKQDLFMLHAGVVGPSALGEQVQSNWHRALGIPRFNGWETQLRDEPGIDVAWLRTWRFRLIGSDDSPACEVLPRVGAEVGTVRNVAKAALQIRFGRRLPADFGELRMRDGLSGSGASYAPRRAARPWTPDSWYVYADFQGEAWARNMMLDGNLWHDSRSVDAERAVAQLSCGVVGIWGHARVALFQSVRTREFRGQSSPFVFGGLTVTVTR